MLREESDAQIDGGRKYSRNEISSGIWRHKGHSTLMVISASIGQRAETYTGDLSDAGSEMKILPSRRQSESTAEH